MKKIIFTLISAVCVFDVHSQTTIVQDDFTDTTKFIDNSALLFWGTPLAANSVFELTSKTDDNLLSFPCLALKPGISWEYYRYSAPYHHRTSSFIDYTFTPISRKDRTITIEFDAVWQRLDNVYGEGGRLVVTLLHDYPAAGLKFGMIDSVQLEAPFGRPAYNLRILNPSSITNNRSGAFLMYGGGHDPAGEFEKYKSGGDTLWWLPGFSSEAGGGIPGISENYPLSGTLKKLNDHIADTTQWIHYKWVVEPEYLRLYVRKTAQPATEERLYFEMAIPDNEKDEAEQLEFMNSFHGTDADTLPPLYNWFEHVEGVRVYFRGGDNTYLANFKVTTDEEVTSIASQRVPDAKIMIHPTLVTEGKVKLIMPDDAPYFIRIYDLQGTVHFQRSGNGTDEIFLSQLKPGLYLAAVEHAGNINTFKLAVR